MPIWLELMVLTLLAYAIGLTIGWFLWGRKSERQEGNGNG